MNQAVLTFLGDVFPKDPVTVDVDLRGGVVPNLESPLTNHTAGYPGKINLKARPANLPATFRPLPVAVSLANNHVMDFGEVGFDDTRRALDAMGVSYFGAGTTADGWHNPCLIDVGDARVALLGYAHASSTPVFGGDGCSGAARLELDAVTRAITDARAQGATHAVVVAHWGDEQVGLPSPECVRLARACVDAGADLIIGHHAHCIQAYEVYRGVHVFYGLGNCIFPAHRSPSYFDEHGRSTRTTDSRPSLRNRRSLAVTWDPATGATTITPLVFDRGRLTRGRFSSSGFRLALATLDGYEARYARAYRWGKLRHTVARFVARPKLPRLRHMRNISKYLRSGTQR